MRYANRIASMMIFVFGIYILVQSRQYDYMAEGTPGPGFVPFWVGLSISLVSLIPLARTFSKFASKMPNPFEAGDLNMFFVVIGGAVFVMVITPLTGLLIALGIMSGGTAKLMGAKNWKTAIGLTVLTPIVLFAIFDVVLGVPLPKGILGF